MIDEASYRLLTAIRELEAARFKDLKAIVRNPRTLTLKLRQLKAFGLIVRDGTLYKLTEKGVRAAERLKDLESILHASDVAVANVERIPHAYYAPVIRKFCEILTSLFGQRLVGVMLFGSVAKGDWKINSDIDLLLVAEGWDGKPVWERLRELRPAERILETSSEYLKAAREGYIPVIQPYPLGVSEAKRFHRIYLDAALDGIILVDREGFLQEVMQKLKGRLQGMGSRRITLPDGKSCWILKDVRPGEVISLE
jgi:hypothetical protein